MAFALAPNPAIHLTKADSNASPTGRLMRSRERPNPLTGGRRHMNLEECYRTLGLTTGASLREVRRSYLQLVKTFHPDRFQSSPELLRTATEETKRLNLAYDYICRVFGLGKRSGSDKRKSGRRSPSEHSGKPPMPGKSFVIPSCGVKLTWITPGRFRMGSPESEIGRSDDEGPQTEVTISRGFWLGVFMVTQEEWKTVAEGASSLNPKPSFFRGDRLPVEQVSWDDCQSWLQVLNSLEKAINRLPDGCEYRLPTEAEWEFACRAGTSTRFHSGNGDDELGEYAWYSGNSSGQIHSVGEKKPNPWGLYDMHGNVWEWCGDWYGGPWRGGTVTDPTGPAYGVKRVFRGGSWGVGPSRCRSAYRVWNKPAYRDYTLGFRLALAPAN